MKTSSCPDNLIVRGPVLSSFKSLMEYVVSSSEDKLPRENDFLLTGFFPDLNPEREKRGILKRVLRNAVKLIVVSLLWLHINVARPLIKLAIH